MRMLLSVTVLCLLSKLTSQGHFSQPVRYCFVVMHSLFCSLTLVCDLFNVGVLYLPPTPASQGGRSSLSNLVPTPEDLPPLTLRPSSLTDDSTSEPNKDDQVLPLATRW